MEMLPRLNPISYEKPTLNHLYHRVFCPVYFSLFAVISLQEMSCYPRS